jgi:hypothetical protein
MVILFFDMNNILLSVTSRSGALTKLIIEDTCSQMIWIFMMMNHLTVMMMRHD